MIPITDFEQHARKFLEPYQSMAQRLQLATEVRDSIEIAHTSEYPNVLRNYFPVFLALLREHTRPQTVDNPEHKLRNVVLEVLNRLPHNEVLRPYVPELLRLALQVLGSDNEDNAIIALRIIFDLHKNFRPHLEQQVQPFLDFVRKIYTAFPATVSTVFFNRPGGAQQPPRPGALPPAPGSSSSPSPAAASTGAPGAPPPVPGAPGASGGGTESLTMSTQSFKVVIECPLIVMFLFQLYPRYVPHNIPLLLPLMVHCISIPGPSQNQLSPDLKQPYADLKGAQIKTVSFLTYLLRGYANEIRPHETSIAVSIVNLLVSCPDVISIRKELLVATRHVLATDFKRGFFAKLDILLEEKALVGTGKACHDTLRPLAYSLLAELIHHFRDDLQLAQLSRIIHLFSRNVHDSSLPLSVQTTCVRLMLNLVETIYRRRLMQEDGRVLLDRILAAFVARFSTLKWNVQLLLEDGGKDPEERQSLRARLELPVQAAVAGHGGSSGTGSGSGQGSDYAKEVADCKQLIRTLIISMKTLLWSMAHFVNNAGAGQGQAGAAQPAGGAGAGSRGMHAEEVMMAARMLRSGVACLALFSEKEDEETFHHFSSMFPVMEPRNLMDVFNVTMPSLFEAILQNNKILQVFAALLQNQKASKHFAEVLAHFLVETKLDSLRQCDTPTANVVLQLFRLLFGSVAKYPAECERVLLPQVGPIMEACLKAGSELDQPLCYMKLLRMMFRALSGGKFELLYRELVPQLQPCINLVLSLLEGPVRPGSTTSAAPTVGAATGAPPSGPGGGGGAGGGSMQDLLVELCLTLPARLSSLLPHLPRLMRPLLMALQGSDELVGLGLRTLEFWLDSLNPEFLEPCLAPIMPQMVLTLWAHLRPKPLSLFGSKALQLLGKMGGRNRRFLGQPLELEAKDNPEHGLRLILTFEPSTSFLVPLDRCIHVARTSIITPWPHLTLAHRRHAFRFLRVCLLSLLNLKGNVDLGGPGVLPQHLSALLLANQLDPARRRIEVTPLKVDLGAKTKTQLVAEKQMFKTLITTLLAAAAEPELQVGYEDTLTDVCHHFALLFHIDSAGGAPKADASVGAGGAGPSGSQALGGDAKPAFGAPGAPQGAASAAAAAKAEQQQANLRQLDPLLFLDALVDVLGSENRLHAAAALKGVTVFTDTLVLLALSRQAATGAPPRAPKASTPGTPVGSSSPLAPPPGVAVAALEKLLPRLLHACYAVSCPAQMGGVMGVGVLVVRSPVELLSAYQSKIVRALLFVLKRLPQHALREQEEASQVLLHVLRVVNSMADAASSSEARKASFQGVLEVLASELFNASSGAIVRRQVQQCLALLASRRGSEVSELLQPIYLPLLGPLLNRQLRSKHVEQQVGTVLCINYCLSLRPPLLKLSPELLTLIQEALSIAEADESVLHGKFLTGGRQAQLLTKLRTACIQLLCTAMAWEDVKAGGHADLRGRTIACFFKSLTCRTPEIVSAAKEGLRQVIMQQRLPKELLQSSLRPILVNLAHYKNLNIPLLQGLARLLELLSNWFSVTLGDKLKEHLRRALEPDSRAQQQGGPQGQHKGWKPGEEPKIAAAILELFHLLPAAAVKFLADLVDLTLQLEGALPPLGLYSDLYSPYTLPLTKFLNRYAAESVDFFLQRLAQPNYFRKFLEVIRSDAGGPLREELARSEAKIIAAAFPAFLRHTTGAQPAQQPTPEQEAEVGVRGIHVVRVLVKLMPDWFPRQRRLFQALLFAWRSPGRLQRLQQEQELPLHMVKESKWLVKCFLNYVQVNRQEVDVLFHLLSIFHAPTRVDFTFLKHFLLIQLPQVFSAPERKLLVTHFLALVQNDTELRQQQQRPQQLRPQQQLPTLPGPQGASVPPTQQRPPNQPQAQAQQAQQQQQQQASPGAGPKPATPQAGAGALAPGQPQAQPAQAQPPQQTPAGTPAPAQVAPAGQPAQPPHAVQPPQPAQPQGAPPAPAAPEGAPQAQQGQGQGQGEQKPPEQGQAPQPQAASAAGEKQAEDQGQAGTVGAEGSSGEQKTPEVKPAEGQAPPAQATAASGGETGQPSTDTAQQEKGTEEKPAGDTPQPAPETAAGTTAGAQPAAAEQPQAAGQEAPKEEPQGAGQEAPKEQAQAPAEPHPPSAAKQDAPQDQPGAQAAQAQGEPLQQPTQGQQPQQGTQQATPAQPPAPQQQQQHQQAGQAGGPQAPGQPGAAQPGQAPAAVVPGATPATQQAKPQGAAGAQPGATPPGSAPSGAQPMDIEPSSSSSQPQQPQQQQLQAVGSQAQGPAASSTSGTGTVPGAPAAVPAPALGVASPLEKQEMVVTALQLMVIPLLAYSMKKDEGMAVLDAAIIRNIVERLLDPPDEVSLEYEEPLHIELLQLATLLIRYLPGELKVKRKELIKFGWNHLKREDSSSKQWAFVNVCHFLDTYQAPEKIILQVFVALLRACQTESRALVKQALDVLMPALPNRLPQEEQKIPMWVRYTKKILVEEGHSLPHLIHIFHLFVRHPNLFYPSRAQFVPQMVSSLQRLGLPANTSLENRRLAVDLAGLVIEWENRRQQEAKGQAPKAPGAPGAATGSPGVPEGEEGQAQVGAKRKAEEGTPGDASKRVKAEDGGAAAGSPAAAGAGAGVGGGAGAKGAAGSIGSAEKGGGDEDYRPMAGMEELVLSFLLRASLASEPRDKDTTSLHRRVLELLEMALDIWPHATVKINYVERILAVHQQQQALLQQQSGGAQGGGADGGGQGAGQDEAQGQQGAGSQGASGEAADQAQGQEQSQQQQGGQQQGAQQGQPARQQSQGSSAAAKASGAVKDISPTLLTILDVICTCLRKQSSTFLAANVQYIVQVLEPCLRSKSREVVASLCSMLRLVFGPTAGDKTGNPSAGPVQPAQQQQHQQQNSALLQQKVEEQVHKQLTSVLTAAASAAAAAAAAGPKGGAGEQGAAAAAAAAVVPDAAACTLVNAALLVLECLVDVKGTAPLDRALPLLIRTAHYLARAVVSKGRAADSAGAASRGGSPGKPESQWHALVSGEGGGGAKGGADEEEGKGAAGGGPALATSPPGKATGAAGSAGQGARGTGAGAGGSFSGPPPTAASNLRTVLGLLGRRVLLFQEYKRQFGMLLQGLLADPSTDKSVVLKILEIVQQWVHTELRVSVDRSRNPQGELVFAGLLNTKVVVNFLQKLAHVDKERYQLQVQLQQQKRHTVQRQPGPVPAPPSPSRKQAPGAPGAPGAKGQAGASSSGAHQPKAEDGTSADEKPADLVPSRPRGCPVDEEPAEGGAKEEEFGTVWERKLLDLLYSLCADSTKYPLAVRQEVFLGVERVFMLGLRASSPVTRRKFFALYNAAIERQLFTRLQFIVKGQEWEALGPSFWLAHALELLLSLILEHEPITLAPNSAHLLPLLASGPPLPVPPFATAASEGGGEEEQRQRTFLGLVNKHAQFMNEAAGLQVADLLLPLREMGFGEPVLAYHLWVLVFPIVWASLHKEEQVLLAKPMINLLSKEYHIKQLHCRPNVVQALLEGISLSQPQPKIPSEVIKYLGKTFNAWHVAIPLLESHVSMFPQDSRCFDALAELYSLLNEDDVLHGLWLRRRGSTRETRLGMSLTQHGFWQEAQDVFFQAMTKAQQGEFGAEVNKAEESLWEEQWLGCAQRLCQWDVLAEFGAEVENYDVLLDSCWRLGNWSMVRERVLPRAQVGAHESTKLAIVRAYSRLEEGSVESIQEADNSIAQGVEWSLKQWWQLPALGVPPHVPLLQQFQQLVELQESARVQLDILAGTRHRASQAAATANNAIMGGLTAQARPGQPGGMPGAGGQAGAPGSSAAYPYMDLKDVLETWRTRLPNEWDDPVVWSDLLQWRNHIYSVVISAFEKLADTSPQLHNLGYRDKAWSVNKLAAVARKQGLAQVCVRIPNALYGYLTMELQEAFVKIREQVKAYLGLGKGKLMTGLNLINVTHLDYFHAPMQSEIFRLKGEFLLRLGDSENANLAFSTAVSSCRSLAKTWKSWAHYCDQVWQESQGVAVWLDYACSCYFQAVKCGAANSRSFLARLLYLLSFENGDGVVGRAFDRHIDNVPYWVWLAWIPQLLLSLQRPEQAFTKAILFKVAAMYPQALYYWLRTHLLERRDIAHRAEAAQRAGNRMLMQQGAGGAAGAPGGANAGHAQQPQNSTASAASNEAAPMGGQAAANGLHNPKGPGQPGQPGPQAGAGAPGAQQQQGQQQRRGPGADGGAASSLASGALSAFDAAKEVMETLRVKHPNLAAELEGMLTEIGARFVPLPEERLLAVVHALLQRCYKYPTATTAEVPVSLKKELQGVCRACFSADTVSKHTDFVNEYKREFELSLDPDNVATFPETLAQLTATLKRWEAMLQANVEERLPGVLKLEEESKQLRDWNVMDVEVPGQYFTDHDVPPEHAVKLDRLGADVPIVRRHGSSHRRLTMIGSDGSQRHFLVQTSLTPSARSDERMVQLFRFFNALLAKHFDTRRRNLAFHAPIIVPVWPQVRLVEDDVTYSTFAEVYELNCARYGREADLPIAKFKEDLNQAIASQISGERLAQLRLKSFREITSKFVSENVMSQFMYKTLPNSNQLWIFKRQFATQLALSSAISFLMLIGGRAPNKILFARTTGKVFQNDFHPAYDHNGVVECPESVPFRLTRNLHTFFTPFGTDGIFVSALCAAAFALLAPKRPHVRNQLALFFRDELISWAWRRPPSAPGPPSVSGANMSVAELRAKVSINVESILRRLNRIAPQNYVEMLLLRQNQEAAGSAEGGAGPWSIQEGVVGLVEVAMKPENLCMMDPTWMPWF